MRRSAFVLSCLLALVPTSHVAVEQATHAKLSASLAPGEWMLAQRGGRNVSPRATARAIAQMRAARRATLRANPSLANTAWQGVGPVNIGGRVVDLAADPRSLNVVYAAAAGGGVWRSDDAGVTFHSVWPDDQTQAIGAIAVAGDATLYAGTGEANPGGGSTTYGGTGMYRSSDGGKRWSFAGLGDSSSIGRIAIDPTDAKHVYVAATGNLFSPGGTRGVYATNDGGAHWRLSLAGANATTGAIDVAIDPTDPKRIYAAMWDRLRTPSARRYVGAGSGIYRSTDAGNTWTQLGVGLPFSNGSLGRIGIAVNPLLAGHVYAVVTQQEGTHFYSSSNGGDSWSPAIDDMFLLTAGNAFPWWFGRVWVDPLAPTHLFAAGLGMVESLDEGRTWVPQPGSLEGTPIHADQHAMAFDPLVPGRVYVGNDGGVYRGNLHDLGGLDLTPAVIQPWTQFYSIDVGEQDPTRIVGGAQDNGSNRSWTRAGTTGSGIWNSYYINDGEETLIDPVDQNVVFACYQYGSCMRSPDGGENSTSFHGSSTLWPWFTPIAFDPSNHQIMYYGGNQVNISLNNGKNWGPVSDVLVASQGTDGYPYGALTSIGVAGADQPGVLYVGTDTGDLWKRDIDGFWGRIDRDPLPHQWITRVTVDPADADNVFVAYSGYREGDPGAHLYRSSDGGETWRDINGNLPGAPVNDVVLADGALIAATDVGVFMTADTSATTPVWLTVGTALPMSPVTDIRYHAPSRTVFAATFGRGMYSFPMP